MSQSIRIENVSRGTTLATEAELANTFVKRGLGLMGRRSLKPGSGLILWPNNSIQMFFMRFPIDVVFVSRDHQVVKVRYSLKPWWSFAGALNARYTIELPAGTLEYTKTFVGDQLNLSPPIDARS